MTFARISGSILSLSLLPLSLGGQNSLELRYDPMPDTPVRIFFNTALLLTTASGQTIGTADLGIVTVVPLELAEGGTVVHLTYDSLRTRIKTADGGWAETPMPTTDSVNWMQVRLDERLLAARKTTGAEMPPVTNPLDVLTGLPGLMLPEQPLPVQGGWVVEAKLPHRGGTALPPNVGDLASLTFWTRITLDSMVARDRDTLGFFTADGYAQINADDNPSSSGGVNIDSGSLVGSLVWSTGWRTFVSGVMQARVHYTKTRSYGESEDVRDDFALALTTRFQVRH